VVGDCFRPAMTRTVSAGRPVRMDTEHNRVIDAERDTVSVECAAEDAAPYRQRAYPVPSAST